MSKLFSHTLFGFRLRTLAILAALGLAALLALAADLHFHGQVYNLFWNVTGETKPAKQLLGFGQYLVRFTRQQPDTEPYAAFEHNNVNPFGVNTFLEQEVEPEKRERQVQMIADAGFHWIRQQFTWQDIEIDHKGNFIDRREGRDLNLDGVVSADEEVSTWEKYDDIVRLTDEYGLEIIARLSTPPAWSQPEGTTNGFTPPADFQDYVDFATTVAARYQGRIHHYQIWNEPNLYPEWGDQTVNAEAYTDLLCRTYTALKAVDPEIVVITGAIGPTIDLSGTNAYDLLYLQRMYQAGAGDCFDVLSVQGYGLWSGPTDRRLRQVTINFPRQEWIRDMMVANGDADKPIWISEVAWDPVPYSPTTIADLDRYGIVTMDEAAAWAPQAYERALDEWPWVGVMAYWYFKPADETNIGQSWYYFRLVEPDFTPTPVYDALKAYITGTQPKTIGPGRHGTVSGALIQREAGAESRTYRIDGTDVSLCYAALDTPMAVYIQQGDTNPHSITLPAGEESCVAVAEDLGPGTHLLTLTAPEWTGLDSLAIVDRTWRTALPWLLAGGLAAFGILIVLGAAVVGRFRA
ncbi:MAG TPA: cellulase family glycosylhydrolase [Aggregatilinea sp.]|uniref:cellulase family glycosylhydrolase n=1 Tax=Aggregatilinea sp. TaxID=2806333 RepID=UPI002C1BBF6F|nr:cellulase family glycosylhydrolase [Aggregatilinea sp.]HML21283.1 cellulase family glycosylhydrolase [Aggregatilinea sp.]